MQPRRALSLLLVCGLFAAAFAVFAYQESLNAHATLGAKAPGFTVENLAGQPVSLGELQGQVVYLNFWASWCPPCQDEAAALQTFHERYGSRVAVVGLDWREPVRPAREFVAEHGLTYRIWRDADGAVAERYRLRGLPENWMLDPAGVLRDHWPGATTFERLQQAYRRTTGQPIDGAGVGPVRAGQRAWSLLATGGEAAGGGGRVTLWLGADDGLYLSRDGGASWRAVPGWNGGPAGGAGAGETGRPPQAGEPGGGAGGGRALEDARMGGAVYALAAIPGDPGDPGRPGYLAAGTEHGVWLAPIAEAASPESWKRLGPSFSSSTATAATGSAGTETAPPPVTGAVTGLAAGRSGLYAWVRGEGLYRWAFSWPEVAAGSWQRVETRGVTPAEAAAEAGSAAVPLPGSPGAGPGAGELSGDGDDASPPSLGVVRDTRVALWLLDGDVAAGPRLLAGTAAGLWSSQDGGRTWRRAGLGRALAEGRQAALPVRGFATAPPGSGGDLLLATDFGIWRAGAAGQAGEPAAERPLRAFSAVASAAGDAWVLAPNGDLYRLSSGAERWQLITPRVLR